MSDPTPNTLADHFEAYLLGQLDDAAMDRLEDELRESPQQADACVEVMATLAMVREQFRDQREQAGELTKDPTLHGFHDLLSELSAMEEAAEAQTVQWVGPIKTNKPIWQQWQFVIPSGIAAILAIAVVLIVALPKTATSTSPSFTNTNTPNEPGPVAPTPSKRVATLTAEYNAQWQTASGNVAPSVGDRLTSGRRLVLAAGSVQITTGSTAVFTVQGPAEFRVHAESRVELVHGKLLARCETPESEGFTVFTDTAEVTDIGTVFAVERNAAGQTITGVLNGHVALSYKVSNEEPRLLKAGEVAGVSAEGLTITTPPTDAIERFSDWGRLLRPVTVTGDATLISNVPSEFPENDEQVHIYREPAGILLDEDLIVSRTEPGLYRPTDAKERSTVAAGTQVDSYFVHINRPNRPTHRVTRTFTLTFDQPVVALIVHTDLLIATNRTLGKPSTRYLKAGGLGLVSKSGFDQDAPQVDTIQWSDDRKTLNVTLNVEDYDQFRVLTLSPDAVIEAGQNE